jgi:hypothetical protein
MNRVAEVNRALKKMGRPERLRRGAGYYYFSEGNAMAWPSSSVYVYRATQFTLERWLEEFEELRKRGEG